MVKYDSFLYGNGLTIGVLSKLKEKSDSKLKRYLDCNNFILDFINAEPHKRILRNFLKYFQIDNETEKNHIEAREYLKANYSEISELGFERWFSKHIFDKNGNKDIKFYGYILYNYWYHIINEEILQNAKINELKNKIGAYILQYTNDKNAIFTTNFDNILDDSLVPQHLHGSFRLPLDKMENVILEHYNEKESEYRYLFGSNGLEKLSRINKIRQLNQCIFDLDFFYDDSINLGSLLIYGLAFGRSEIMSEAFLEQYPEYRDNKLQLVKTVDGHILLKLQVKYQKKKLDRITIAYYSESDRTNYIDLFENTDLQEIIEYKKCDDIFNWEDALR
jgi:hypothetical protein